MSSVRNLFFILTFLFLLSPSAHAGFEKIDSGTGTKQIVADGGELYALKDSGEVWRYFNGNWYKIGAATGGQTREISVRDGFVVALNNNSDVWFYDRHQWTKIHKNNEAGHLSMLTFGDQIWALGDLGNVFFYNQGQKQWNHAFQVTGRITSIYAARNYVWLIAYDGQLWRFGYLDSKPYLIGESYDHAQIVARDGTDCYTLKTSGDVWQRISFAWSRIFSSPDVYMLAYDFPYVYMRRNSGEVSRWKDGAWGVIDSAPDTKAIAAGNGALYELKFNGNIWRWRP